MAIPNDKIQITAVVTKELHGKLKMYADRIGISDSRFVANVLEMAMENEKWLLEFLTSWWGRKLRGVVGDENDPERIKRKTKQVAKNMKGLRPGTV